MLKTDLDRIGVFFFLSLMDEYSAVIACQNSAKEYKSALEVLKIESCEVELIRICKKNLNKVDHKKSHSNLTVLSRAFKWPDQINPTPWREFYRQSKEELREAIIWLVILKLPIEKISNALGVSEGTLRYRASNSLSLIGKLTRPTLRSI